MTAILLALMVGSIVAFWNVDSYIRAHREMPSWKEFWRVHVGDSNRRAYYFFIALAFFFLILGIFDVVTTPLNSLTRWIRDSGVEVVWILVFVSGLANYVVRTLILRRRRDAMPDKGEIYVWDSWTVRKRDCATPGESRALKYVNALVAILLALITLLTIVDKLGEMK